MQSASAFLVEDEALIRMMIVEMLVGHRTVAKAGSIQTAELLARTTVFDLAVFDINVVGFNIAEIVAARGLPFIFVSGYGRPAGQVQGQAGTAQAILDFRLCDRDQFGSERHAETATRMNKLLGVTIASLTGRRYLAFGAFMAAQFRPQAGSDD